ncbi:MAG: serine hydrolase domain-containing protein [Dehalococcoidia bacterium]
MIDTPEFEELSPRLERLIQDRFTEARLPGLAIGVVHGDSLAWSRGFGFADVERRRPPGEMTISRVASVTKTFTATAILQLRDAGMLALDDPLLVHVPEFTSVNALSGTLEDVTIRRLLTHHSGLTSEPPLPTWETPSFPSMDEVLDAMPQAEVVIPQDFAWKYSNFAFGLLGEVIERLTGRRYAEYVHSEILVPLGMEWSAFELDGRLREHFATGYSPPATSDPALRAAPYAPMNGLASAGQLHSNIVDLAKWVTFQFSADSDADAPAPLGQRTLAEMHRPVYIAPDWSWGQALGWRVTRMGDRVYHNHGGGIHGFASQIMFNRPAKLGVIALANMWPVTAAAEIATEVMQMVMDELSDSRAGAMPGQGQSAETVGEGDTAMVKVSPEHLDEFAGHYWAEPGVPVRLIVENDVLVLDRPKAGEYTLHAPAALEATDTADVFRVRHGRAIGERAVFRRSSQRAVEGFLLGGFFYRRTGGRV